MDKHSDLRTFLNTVYLRVVVITNMWLLKEGFKKGLISEHELNMTLNAHENIKIN